MEIVEGIKANTSKGTTGRVLKLLKGRPAGRILDAPAGAGALSQLLRKRGHDVTALDIDGGSFAADDIELVVGDLNERLPFPDEHFDCATCVDGIEHLEDPFSVVGEFARVLCPGGELIISTPNISAFRSRARFMFTGFHNKGKTPLREDEPTPLHHINLITYPECRYMLRRAGLEVTRVTTNRVKAASLPYVLLYPLVAAGTSVAFRHEKDARQRETNRDIYRQMMSWPVAMGETMIVSARKPAR
jgi:2-polyprenyl-3-methyl-5-hydroxy-6-metoxy-1,4-benzoquinol methylase